MPRKPPPALVAGLLAAVLLGTEASAPEPPQSTPTLEDAPGRFTGYGAKTLPGVREAIEERRFDDANL